MKFEEVKTCDCDICKISKRIQSIESTWDEETKSIVNDLGDLWESDSMDAGYWKSKYSGIWPIESKSDLIHEISETKLRLENLKNQLKTK